jgi:hypothetical protein
VPPASAAHHVARAMLERAAGKPFEVVEVADERASLADVARRADLGLITTHDIRTRSAAAGADLRPVVTLRRQALFGPPKLEEDLTRNLAQAALTACARPAALIRAGEANLRLALPGARGPRADARAGPAGGAPRLFRRTVSWRPAGSTAGWRPPALLVPASARAPGRSLLGLAGGRRRQGDDARHLCRRVARTFRRVVGMISSVPNGPGKCRTA